MQMKFVAPRFDDQRPSKQVGSFLEPVEVFDRERQIVERVGIIGAEFKCLAIDRFRFVEAL